MCTNNYLIIWVAPKKTISDDPDGLDHILMINFSNWAVCLGQLIWRYLDQHFPSLMIATNYFSIRLWSNSDHLFVTWKTRRISRTDSETIHSRWVFTKLLESRFMADSDRPLLGVQSFDLPFGISLKKKPPSLAGKKRDTVPDWLSFSGSIGLRDCPLPWHVPPRSRWSSLGPYSVGRTLVVLLPDCLDNLSWKIPHKYTGWTGFPIFPHFRDILYHLVVEWW